MKWVYGGKAGVGWRWRGCDSRKRSMSIWSWRFGGRTGISGLGAGLCGGEANPRDGQSSPSWVAWRTRLPGNFW